MNCIYTHLSADALSPSSTTSTNKSSSATPKREVPMVYLDQCLKSAPYARDLAPFLVDDDPFLLYAFALNELIGMDFSGLMQLKATVFMMWREPRLRWHKSVVPPPPPSPPPLTSPAPALTTTPVGPRLEKLSSIDIGIGIGRLINPNRTANAPRRPSNSTAPRDSDLGGRTIEGQSSNPNHRPISSEERRRVKWVWPDNVDLEANRLWMPRLQLLNCMKRQCILVPGNDSLVQLSKHGFVRVTFTAYLEASCNMNLVLSCQLDSSGFIALCYSDSVNRRAYART